MTIQQINKNMIGEKNCNINVLTFNQRFSPRTMKLNFATLYRDLFNAALDRTDFHPMHLRSI
jgi:hypothetical protein